MLQGGLVNGRVQSYTSQQTFFFSPKKRKKRKVYSFQRTLPQLPQEQTGSHSSPVQVVSVISPVHECSSRPHRAAQWGQKSLLWNDRQCDSDCLAIQFVKNTCRYLDQNFRSRSYPVSSYFLSSWSPDDPETPHKSFSVWKAQCSEPWPPSGSLPAHTETPHTSASTQTRPTVNRKISNECAALIKRIKVYWLGEYILYKKRFLLLKTFYQGEKHFKLTLSKNKLAHRCKQTYFFHKQRAPEKGFFLNPHTSF